MAHSPHSRRHHFVLVESMNRFALALAALVLAACAHAPLLPPEPAPVILISVDGLRSDYLNRHASPTLSRLAAEGARASMRASFPTITFPNHYTLVTGLRPDHHGVVNNRMEDAARPGVTFTLSNRDIAADPIWWNDGTPLWVTAERAGVHAGTMFWPGSEVEIHGVRPSQWLPFDQSMPGDARVDTLLSWLDLPPAERPRFFTLYFDIVDTAGHRFGPDSEETNAAVTSVNSSIARLLAGLAARGLEGRANIIIVSDHGMADVSEDRIIDLDALAPPAISHVVWDGSVAGINALPGREAELTAGLVGRGAHGECWRRDQLPARFEYGAHRRVPLVVCLGDVGWRYRTATIAAYSGAPSRGAHGFDNEAPEMAATFIAYGPAFRSGRVLPTFDNVSVYPLLARLVGVAPEPNDGDIADVEAALR